MLGSRSHSPQSTGTHSHPALPNFILTADTDLLLLGGNRVLFSEAQQKIFQLNDRAAHVAASLAGGCTLPTLVDDWVEAGAEPLAAEAILRDLILNWSKQQIAAASFDPAATKIHVSRTIAVGGVEATISYSSQQLAERVGAVFEHLIVRKRKTETRYHLQESGGFTLISRNEGPCAVVAPAEAAPALKAYLTHDVMRGTVRVTALHAACIGTQEGALLITGKPGEGKTTLTTALMEAGFRYYADDVTLLDERGRVHGVCFAPAAKRGGWHLLERRYRELPIHTRLDGRQVRYLPIPIDKAVEGRGSGWRRIAGIVKLCRRRTGAASLIRLNPAEALSTLLEEGYTSSGRATIQTIRALSKVVSSAKTFQLAYSDLGSAVQALAREYGRP